MLARMSGSTVASNIVASAPVLPMVMLFDKSLTLLCSFVPLGS
jgi:hypothetical protein